MQANKNKQKEQRREKENKFSTNIDAVIAVHPIGEKTQVL